MIYLIVHSSSSVAREKNGMKIEVLGGGGGAGL